ncbi:hypothetical protein [Aliarcobacter skirrowii]|uniref:hypothetical protein n=1 Tax=Aliarcobacter skirrowii TaxID=28200 RepID=UPI0029AD01A2|nr:hypothetical protein [Aliarcobacter skirrowii]MDX4038998.1 hypothetical protein [Aliarcobacter skirrowii]
MKKKILLLMLLSSLQLFALECTKEQYYPYFYVERYLPASTSTNMNKSVFDKKSVKYDNKNIIRVWFTDQLRQQPNVDIMLTYTEFNIKDNTYRFLQHTGYKCNGRLLGVENGDEIWKAITPESVMENKLETLKKYLKIK